MVKRDTDKAALLTRVTIQMKISDANDELLPVTEKIYPLALRRSQCNCRSLRKTVYAFFFRSSQSACPRINLENGLEISSGYSKPV